MAFAFAQNTGFQTSGSVYTPLSGGNLLVLVLVDTGSSTQPSYTLSAGWVHVPAADAVVATSPFANTQIWYYPDVPAASLTVTITGGSSPQFAIIEFSGGGTAPVPDVAGPATSGATVASLAVATSSATTAQHDCAVAVVNVNYASATKTTLSAGTGFTQGPALNQGVKTQQHLAADYQADTGTSLAVVTDTEAFSTNAGPVAASICTFMAGTAAAPPPAGAVPPGLLSPASIRRHFPGAQPLYTTAAAPAAPAEQLLPPPPPAPRAAHRARMGRLGACAAGILAATTLAPQPSQVPPARPQPVIQHLAPHRVLWRGLAAPAAAPYLTAKLPPSAVSPRPPHRGTGKGVLAKTTLSPQPATVFPLPQPVPVRRPGAHRVLWRGVTGPPPAAAAAAVAPAPAWRPQPRTPAPHRAAGKGVLAKTTLAAQPSSVPPARPQPVIQHLPPHRGTGKGILVPATLAAQPAVVYPLPPPPPVHRPGPHRATGKGVLAPGQAPQVTAKLPPTALSPRPPHRAIGKGILAATTLSPQPSRVPPPLWRQPFAPRPAHRALWRAAAGPAPAVVAAGAAPPARPAPVIQHPAPHRAIPAGKGVLAKTTLSPQPSSVPPARPQPAIGHPAPHRATAKGILGPAQPSYTTARLPSTAVSPRPPHRGIGKGVLAGTTLSPQPARVPPPAWRQPNAPRPPHRGTWRVIAGPAPAVVVPAVAPPSRPQPVIAHPAPHRAIPVAKGVLAKTTFSAQPSSVPAPHWQPQPRRPGPHRGTWRALPAAPPAAVPPSRPAPVTNRPPAPHRATGKGILAKTTLAAQPASVRGPQWRQPFAPRPAHRAIWRAAAGPQPPPPPFSVARSTPTVTAPGTSAPAVSDPRDGTHTVTPAAASAPAVSDPRDGTRTVTPPATSNPGVS